MSVLLNWLPWVSRCHLFHFDIGQERQYLKFGSGKRVIGFWRLSRADSLSNCVVAVLLS